MTPRDLTAQAAAAAPLNDPLLDTAVQAVVPGATPVPGTGSVRAQVDRISGPPAAPQAQTFLQLAFPNAPVEVAPPGSAAISQVFSPEVQHWGSALSRWAAKAGIDPNLAAVVMQIELCGDPSATSSAGAIGLFQVMPYHFAATDSPYDPDTNGRAASITSGARCRQPTTMRAWRLPVTTAASASSAAASGPGPPKPCAMPTGAAAYTPTRSWPAPNPAASTNG